MSGCNRPVEEEKMYVDLYIKIKMCSNLSSENRGTYVIVGQVDFSIDACKERTAAEDDV